MWLRHCLCVGFKMSALHLLKIIFVHLTLSLCVSLFLLGRSGFYDIHQFMDSVFMSLRFEDITFSEMLPLGLGDVLLHLGASLCFGDFRYMFFGMLFGSLKAK